jgi:hypothetical protein
MEQEFKSLQEMGTWELVALAIHGGWLYRVKELVDGTIKFKARFVARGNTQIEGVDFSPDSISSPVVKLKTVRLLIALANQLGLDLHQGDIASAYLHSPIKEEVFMHQPQGFEQGHNLVCRLRRCLYGLKQAGKAWNETIDGVLSAAGFEHLGPDLCAYKYERNGLRILLGLFVDDILCASNGSAARDFLKSVLEEHFTLSDWRVLSRLLGMVVTRDRERGIVKLAQPHFIAALLLLAGLQDCRPVSTPAVVGVSLAPSPKPVVVEEKEYRRLVGGLRYLCDVSRPDIAAAVGSCCRYVQRPEQHHWVALKRVLRYLAGTQNLGITFIRPASAPELFGFCDANWAGCLETRRSTTGYVFIFSGPISWRSRIQTSVALSSAEAEYLAACDAAKEVVWLRAMLTALGFAPVGPTVVWEDNQACIQMSTSDRSHDRTKHIDMRYHFVREQVAAGSLVLRYVPSRDNVADLLTKPLGALLFKALLEKLLGL